MKFFFLFTTLFIMTFNLEGQIKINSPYSQKQKDKSYIPDTGEETDTPVPGDGSMDEQNIAQIVNSLFTAMHQSDGNKIKSLFAPEGRLMSTDEAGKINVITVDQFSQMINQAVKGSLEEKISGMEIKIDDNLATVWAEYDFFYNKALQHCGVDAFQLFKGTSGWKIIQISDTRRKNCATEGKASTINRILDDWHAAAASANAQKYFGMISADGVYLGTDATENWDKNSFMAFAKPYFDKGDAWKFTPKNRQVYFSDDNNIAWFNEQLDTWMGPCRGSGVLEKQANGEYKIRQYNLSILVPNDLVQDYLKLLQK